MRQCRSLAWDLLIRGELKKILDGEGLKVCATRTSFPQLQNEFGEGNRMEKKFLECDFTAVGQHARGVFKMRKATEVR